MTTIIGSAGIEIRAHDKFFERDVKKAVGQLKDIQVPLKVQANLDDAKRQIGKFRTEQNRNWIKLKVTADTKNAETKLNKLYDKYSKKTLQVNVDSDGLKSAAGQIDDFFSSYHDKQVKVKIDTDHEQLMETGMLLDDFLDHYHGQKASIDVEVNESVAEKLGDIKDHLGQKVNINANADTAAAEAQLAFASRPRTTTITAKLNPRTQAAMMGFFHTLTGTLPMEQIRNAITGIMANYETLTTKTGLLTAGLGGLSGAAIDAAGSILTIGGDVTKVVGLLSAAPAALAVGGVALAGTILGWKGFGEAVAGEGKKAAEALKGLPPEAQAAAIGLRGFGGAVREATQTKYWDAMGTAVQDTRRAIENDLTKGMGTAGLLLGNQMRNSLVALQDFANYGGLKNTFKGINGFLDESTEGVHGLTKGFLEFLEGGSRSMPKFGRWLGDLGTQFGNWAEESNRSGMIDEWILSGTERMKELGNVTKGTYKIFSGLTASARAAGGASLKDFADGFIDVANVVNSVDFQKKMTEIFRGAKTGAQELGQGFGAWGDLISRNTPAIREFLEVSGKASGTGLKSLTKIFDGTGLGTGLQELLKGVTDGFEHLGRDGFPELGHALGQLGQISGEVIRNMAPGLGQLFGTIDTVVSNMSQGIQDAMPVFNDFVQNVLITLRSVLGPIASGVGNLLSVFSQLPGVIQTAVLAFAAFMALSKKFPVMMNRITSIPQKMQASTSGFITSTSRIGSALNSNFVGPMTQAQAKTRAFVTSQRNAAGQIASIWANNSKRQQAILLDGAVRRAQITKQIQTREATLARNNTSGVGNQVLPAVAGAGIASGLTRLQSNTKTVAQSVKTNLGSIGKTAGVVGGQITKGLGAAVGGLTSVLGGPWGVALTAGIGLVADFGKKQIDAKARVDTLRDSMGQFGQVTSETKKVMTDQLFQQKGGLGGLMDRFDAFARGQAGGTNMKEIFDKTGTNAQKMVEKMAAGGEEFTNVWKDIEKTSNEVGGNLFQKVASDLTGIDFDPGASGKKLLEMGKVTEDMVQKTGMTRKEFEKLNGTELTTVSRQIAQVTADTERAEAMAAHYGRTFTQVAKDQARDNKLVLESTSSTLDEKMGAFKSNMQILGLEQLSGQSGFYQLGVVAEQNSSKIKELKTTLGEAGKSLRTTFDTVDVGAGKNVAMFKMNTETGRQMYDVMRTQADGIHAATMSTYDTVLKQTQSVDQATQAAMQRARADTKAFADELSAAGLSDSAITSLMETAGLSDTDIEIALTTKGVDQAISEALRVEAALIAFRSGDYSATLSLEDAGVQAQIRQTLGLAEGFSNQEFVTKIAAHFTNEAQYQAWMQEFTQATPEQRIKMLMELTGADTAMAKVDEALGKGKQLDNKTWTSTIELMAKETGMSVDEINAKINSMPSEQIKKILLETEGDPIAKLKALIGSEPFTKKIQGEVVGDPGAEFKAKLGTGEMLKINIQPEVQNPPDLKSMFGLGASGPVNTFPIKADVQPVEIPDIPEKSFDVRANVDPGAISSINNELNSLSDKNINVNVQANESNLANIKGQMEALNDKTVSVNINASESGLGFIKSQIDALNDKTVNVSISASESGLGFIKSQIDALNNKTVTVSVNASESNLGYVKSQIDGLHNKTVSVSVNANPGGVLQIQSAMNSLKNKTVTANVRANAGAVTQVSSALNSLRSKTVTVTTNASTGPVNALKSAIGGIANKSVTISTTANTAPARQLKSAIDAVRSKSVSVTASTNVGAVNSLRAAIAAVRGKTVTVTVRTNRVGDNANGGVYMGGVQTFARGGFDPRIARAIARHERLGKKENHVAQIAKGSNNYRVWGEPETQGEAYIPLAKSKRARSLKILEQVAQHFGVSLSQQFADGGFLGGQTVASGVTTFARGGTTKQTAAQKKAATKAKADAKKRKENLKKLTDEIKKSISELKKAFSSGLGDLKKVFGAGEASPAQKALGDMRSAVSKFKSETSKQIKESKKLGKSTKTLSSQVKAATKLDKKIATQRVSSKVWSRRGDNLSDSRYIGRDAINRQKRRGANYNAKFTVRDYERAMDYLSKELEKQQNKLEKMNDNHKRAMEGVANSLFGQFNLSSLVNKKDEFGYRPPTTARDISSYASKMLSDMKKFSSNLNALRKAGYNEAIINQIANMDLEEALVVSQALLSDKSQLKSINSSFTQMFGARGDSNIASDGTTYVGGLARSIGSAGANAMFKAGIDVQKGLVNGLTSEVRAVEKAGQALADALVKSFKKALKIKSPSRVFMGLGKFIPQGLTKGIDSGQKDVNRSISGLVQPRRLDTSLGGNSSNSSGIMNGRTGSSDRVVVNVHPSQGMSEVEVGKTAAREIYFRTDSALI